MTADRRRGGITSTTENGPDFGSTSLPADVIVVPTGSIQPCAHRWLREPGFIGSACTHACEGSG